MSHQPTFELRTYRTKSVSVEKGVAAGDTISALLFILVQEILTRATRRSGEVVRCPRVQEVVPSIRGFMDDLTSNLCAAQAGDDEAATAKIRTACRLGKNEVQA